VHVELAASVVPQFEEIRKSVAFVPVMVIELMVSVAVPVFRTVTELVDEVVKSRTIPKLIDVGESCTLGEPTDEKLTAVTFPPFTVTF
jgi:hypothetical protein